MLLGRKGPTDRAVSAFSPTALLPPVLVSAGTIGYWVSGNRQIREGGAGRVRGLAMAQEAGGGGVG
jgi:hypothetical protein